MQVEHAGGAEHWGSIPMKGEVLARYWHRHAATLLPAGHSMAINGNQWQSMAINGNQCHLASSRAAAESGEHLTRIADKLELLRLKALRRLPHRRGRCEIWGLALPRGMADDQKQSEAIGSNQKQSEAILALLRGMADDQKQSEPSESIRTNPRAAEGHGRHACNSSPLLNQ